RRRQATTGDRPGEGCHAGTQTSGTRGGAAVAGLGRQQEASRDHPADGGRPVERGRGQCPGGDHAAAAARAAGGRMAGARGPAGAAAFGPAAEGARPGGGSRRRGGGPAAGTGGGPAAGGNRPAAARPSGRDGGAKKGAPGEVTAEELGATDR